MFYVKEKFGVAEINIEINSENTYTLCPDCGAEHQIDLCDVIETIGELDLCGGTVYCEDCSLRRQKNRTLPTH